MELPEFNIEDFNKWKEGKVIIKVNKLVNMSTFPNQFFNQIPIPFVLCTGIWHGAFDAERG